MRITLVLQSICGKGCLALLAALGLAACDAPPGQVPAGADSAANAPDERLAPGEHEWTAADGNPVPYDVAGEGEATVLLVHCWMCERTFWSEQVPVLAAHYRTVALDLPGHGEAGTAREAWTVAGFGEDVAAFIDDLGLDDVVLVGHSMGGPVSLRAAALAGERVRGIVAVDTLHDAEFEYSGEEVEQFMAAFEQDFSGTCEAFVQQMFPEEGSERIMRRVQETSCAEHRREAGVALMRDFGTIDMAQWFAEAGVPIRAINAAGPTPTRTEANRRYADFEAVFLDDAGHYLQMTRPERFNPLLLEAVADILGGET